MKHTNLSLRVLSLACGLAFFAASPLAAAESHKSSEHSSSAHSSSHSSSEHSSSGHSSSHSSSSKGHASKSSHGSSKGGNTADTAKNAVDKLSGDKGGEGDKGNSPNPLDTAAKAIDLFRSLTGH